MLYVVWAGAVISWSLNNLYAAHLSNCVSISLISSLLHCCWLRQKKHKKIQKIQKKYTYTVPIFTHYYRHSWPCSVYKIKRISKAALMSWSRHRNTTLVSSWWMKAADSLLHKYRPNSRCSANFQSIVCFFLCKCVCVILKNNIKKSKTQPSSFEFLRNLFFGDSCAVLAICMLIACYDKSENI